MYHTTEPSVAVLLGGIIKNAKDLPEQEVMMLKLEARDQARTVTNAALTLGMVKQALPPPTLPHTSTRTKQASQSSDRLALTPATLTGTPINGAIIF